MKNTMKEMKETGAIVLANETMQPGTQTNQAKYL